MPEASPTTEELISRRAKPPRRTVLFINQLGKGLQGRLLYIMLSFFRQKGKSIEHYSSILVAFSPEN